MPKGEKLEGFVDGIAVTRERHEIASITLFTDKVFDDLVPATLYIGGGKLFTEDQVRGLLEKFQNEARRLFLLHTSGMKQTGQVAGLPSTAFNNDIRAFKNSITL